MQWLVMIAIVLAPVLANGAPAPAQSVHREPPMRRFAIGSSIFLGGVVGGSAYVGASKHHGFRFNVARYGDHKVNPGAKFLISVLDGGDDGDGRDGAYLDVGAGWMFFPRRLWDGFSLELGLVRRELHTRRQGETEQYVTRDSVKYAGRALVGWTWALRDNAVESYFVSVALGASYGPARGGGMYFDEHGSFVMQTAAYRFDHWEPAFEGFVRAGFAFGDL